VFFQGPSKEHSKSTTISKDIATWHICLFCYLRCCNQTCQTQFKKSWFHNPFYLLYKG